MNRVKWVGEKVNVCWPDDSSMDADVLARDAQGITVENAVYVFFIPWGAMKHLSKAKVKA